MLFFEKWMSILRRNGFNVNYEATSPLNTNIFNCVLSAKIGNIQLEYKRSATPDTHNFVRDSLMGDLLKHAEVQALPYTE